MRTFETRRAVVRCPNQHEFEAYMFDLEQLAIQPFVCELCGAKFNIDTLPPQLIEQLPESGKPGPMEGSAEKR